MADIPLYLLAAIAAIVPRGLLRIVLIVAVVAIAIIF